MIEKDTIQELFSKAFENHTAPVKPELWTGVQAKMSAAGVAGAGGAAAKGLSVLTKWAIGSAALTSAAVVTTVVVMSSGDEKPTTTTPTYPTTEQTINSTTEQPTVAQNQEETTAVNTVTPQDRTIRFVPPTIVDRIDDSFDVLEFGPVLGSVDDNVGTVESPGYDETSGDVDPKKQVGQEPAGNVTDNHEGSNETVVSVQKDPEVAAAKLELPNVFTPNGDGANDFYKFNRAENIKSLEVTILDANSKEVFRSNEINFEWNGTLFNGGDQAPEGIYTCLVQYRDMANGMKTQTSYIYLKR